MCIIKNMYHGFKKYLIKIFAFKYAFENFLKYLFLSMLLKISYSSYGVTFSYFRKCVVFRSRIFCEPCPQMRIDTPKTHQTSVSLCYRHGDTPTHPYPQLGVTFCLALLQETSFLLPLLTLCVGKRVLFTSCRHFRRSPVWIHSLSPLLGNTVLWEAQVHCWLLSPPPPTPLPPALPPPRVLRSHEEWAHWSCMLPNCPQAYPLPPLCPVAH